ncbi:MAG TPA: enoyl-CoA hydratase-related protein, partial [Amphiplicatus sp.]|nr:enoyl-CoA hydratase-related protein [Amphiplicatus sp.]
RMMDVEEAERCGLVSRIIPKGELREEAIRVAKQIAAFSRPIAILVKDSVNRSYETGLTEGVRVERRLFHSLFGTEDQREGMAAFIEKRKPNFKNR